MTTQELIAALPALADGVLAHVSYTPAFEYEGGETVGVTVLALLNRNAPEGRRLGAFSLADGFPMTMQEAVEALRAHVAPYGYFKGSC